MTGQIKNDAGVRSGENTRGKVKMSAGAHPLSGGRLFSNRQLLSLILPLVVEQFLAIVVGLADSIMVSAVGEAAVSGVSLVDNIMILCIAAFSALATGGAVIAGQYLGHKERGRACQAATQMLWFILVFSIIIMGVLYACKWLVLHVIFGSIDAQVMGHANIYLLIVSASIPFIALYNGGAAIFRTMGISKIPMYVSFLMNLINVSGNALLVYRLRWGTAGVAIPTLTSRIVAAVIILLLLRSRNRDIYLTGGLRCRPNWNIIRRILQIGLPNGLENSMFQIGKIIVLSLVSTFGVHAIAANAISNTLASFQILPGMAIGLGVTAVISRCIGAGDIAQARYYTRKLMWLTYISMWIVNGLFFLFLHPIIDVYGVSAQTSRLTADILHFHMASCMLIWPLSFTLPSMLRAAGDAKVTMYISLASMWIFRIVFSYLLGGYFGMGVFGIWIAMVIDWCVRAVLMSLRYFSGVWTKFDLIS